MISFPSWRCFLPAAILISLLIPLCAPAAEPGRTFGGFFYPTNSLGYALAVEMHALTNGRTENIDATIGLAGGRWNTNFFFFGCTGITAITHWKSNSTPGTDFIEGTAFRKTALSRVVLITAGHIGGEEGVNTGYSNQFQLFIDRTNGQHWARVVRNITRTSHGNDYAVMALASPLPASIEVMPVCLPSNVTRRLPANAPWPLVQTCQHGRAFSQTWPLGSPHAAQGGDSGSPTFFVLNDQCYFYPEAYSAPRIQSLEQFLADLNTVTQLAGYSTNDYPVTLFEPTNYPKWPY